MIDGFWKAYITICFQKAYGDTPLRNLTRNKLFHRQKFWQFTSMSGTTLEDGRKLQKILSEYLFFVCPDKIEIVFQSVAVLFSVINNN